MLRNPPVDTASRDEELWRLGLDVNGDTLGTRVEHTLGAARAQSAFLRATMLATGWTRIAE